MKPRTPIDIIKGIFAVACQYFQGEVTTPFEDESYNDRAADLFHRLTCKSISREQSEKGGIVYSARIGDVKKEGFKPGEERWVKAILKYEGVGSIPWKVRIHIDHDSGYPMTTDDARTVALVAFCVSQECDMRNAAEAELFSRG